VSDVDWHLVALGLGAGALVVIAVLVALHLALMIKAVKMMDEFDSNRAYNMQSVLNAIHDDTKATKDLQQAVHGVTVTLSARITELRESEELGVGGIFR
jgi:hypothetical protein